MDEVDDDRSDMTNAPPPAGLGGLMVRQANC